MDTERTGQSRVGELLGRDLIGVGLLWESEAFLLRVDENAIPAEVALRQVVGGEFIGRPEGTQSAAEAPKRRREARCLV